MTAEIRDDDVMTAFRDTMGDKPRSFVKLLEQHSPDFCRTVANWADACASLKGSRGTKPYIEEAGRFMHSLNFAMAVFYHARGGRLPVIEDDLIERILEDEGAKESIIEDTLEVLGAHHPSLRDFFRAVGRSLGDSTYYTLLLATRILSTAVEEDAKDRPGRGPLLEYMVGQTE